MTTCFNLPRKKIKDFNFLPYGKMFSGEGKRSFFGLGVLAKTLKQDVVISFLV